MWVVVIPAGLGCIAVRRFRLRSLAIIRSARGLHPVGSEQGWDKVFGPTTGQRGWIYAKYYLEPIDGPRKRMAVQDAQASSCNETFPTILGVRGVCETDSCDRVTQAQGFH